MNFIDFAFSRSILSQPICTPMTPDLILYAVEFEKIRFDQLNQEEKDFYNKEIQIDLEGAVNISSDIFQQKRKVRLEHRISITASVVNQFITYVNNNDPNWDTKIYNRLNNKFQGSTAAAHGIKNEALAREEYVKRIGLKVVQSGLLVNPLLPWLGYSPDGIVINDRIIKIKCLEKGATLTIDAVIPTVDYLQTIDGVEYLKKRNYYCQVQLGMFITSLKKCDPTLFATYDKSMKIIQVSYNELCIKSVWPKLMFVYFRYLLKN